MTLTLELIQERFRRASQAPENAGPETPDCCKRPGSLVVTTEDCERFTGTCPVCGRKHRRAFPDLTKLAQFHDGGANERS